MKRLTVFVVLIVAAAAAAALAGARYLDARGISAHRLATYIEGRQQGHNGAVVAVGDMLQSALYATVAPAPVMPDMSRWPVGATAQVNASMPPPTITIGNTEALRHALAQAVPGQVIALAPGRYAIAGEPLQLNRAGSAAAPITLRGPAPGEGAAELVVNIAEGMVVSAPYWRVQGLQLRGGCASDSDCDHAFHIVAGGSHFYAGGNTLMDFNAHFKINGSDGRFPDFGVLERNTLSNHDVRHTGNAVTPIDMVAASGWQIRGNLITDFVKGEGDQISFGAYAKGAGKDNRFERNVVWCEQRLRGRPGARVGLSFGGGGSGPSYCRDQRCIVEQEGGVMESNLVAACSDDGIYLNNAANTRISNNSLLGTTGISVRFAGSSATLDGNLIEGPVRSRNGGVVRDGDNISAAAGWGLLGGAAVDLAHLPARHARAGAGLPADVCGNARSAQATYGAVDRFAACGAPGAK